MVKGIAAFFVCIAAVVFAQEKHYRAAVRHIESGGIGYNQGYTTLELFLASDPCQWCVIPFVDLKGHVFNNKTFAANGGAGLRALLGNMVYGVNTYYDYRQTDRLHSNQIGAGLEVLGEVFDFRINGYLPFGKKISNPYNPLFSSFEGHYMLEALKYELAMKGANAECGFHVKKTNNFEFYVAAGPYYFIGEFGPNLWGGKIRTSWMYKDLVRLEISDSYDRTFHNRFQGEVSVGFSFGPTSKTSQCASSEALISRLIQPVGRQEIVVMEKQRRDSIAIDPATGLPYFFVFVNNTGTSDGSYESPYHTLADAQANSSPRDVLYVFPGDGTTLGMNAGITLKNDQKFWGSGVEYTLTTTQGDVLIPSQTSTSPQITNTGGHGVTLAVNNDVSGFTIASVLSNAIFGTNPQNVSISNNTIQNNTSFALFPVRIVVNAGSLNATINNNSIHDNACGAISFVLNGVDLAEIAVTSNAIANNASGVLGSAGSALVINAGGSSGGNCSLTLENNTISGNAASALYSYNGSFNSYEVIATNNLLTGNSGTGCVFLNSCNVFTLTATENTISNGGDNGIMTAGSATMATAVTTFTENQIIGNTAFANGIFLNHAGTNLTFIASDNQITGNASAGIAVNADVDNLVATLENNTISDNLNTGGNPSGGVSLTNFGTLAGTFTNNTLLGNTTSGVFIGSINVGPYVCLEMRENNTNTGYVFSSGSGTFNLAPCNVSSINTGTITPMGTITIVKSCPGAVVCPP